MGEIGKSADGCCLFDLSAAAVSGLKIPKGYWPLAEIKNGEYRIKKTTSTTKNTKDHENTADAE
jgi:hypothetical protein